MKRPLKLLVAIMAIALVGSGCGSDGASSTLSDAATMRYTLKGEPHTLHVSRARLLSEVRSLVTNKPFAKFLKEQSFTIDPHDLSADSKLTAIWLTQLIQQATIDELFAARHLKVTAEGRARAAKSAAGFFPAETIFPAFSEKFRSTLIDRQARSEALLASYTKTSDADGEAYFRANQATFGCASGKNVAHILVKTQAEAQTILDQLAAGGSFATLAAQKSTDGSAQQGGKLGCLKAGEFVPAFQSAAETAPVGTPVGPVKTQFGYHVILATKAPAVTYASARAQVLDALKTKGQQDLSTAVNGIFKLFKPHIDARFGTWKLVTNSQGQQAYQVTPPKAPTPATSREGTTTTTLPVGSP